MVSSEILKHFEKLVTAIPGLELKGATMPYVSVNGHMFAFLDKEGNFALRLSSEDREIFISKFKTGLFPAHGTVLKEYVSVPSKLLGDFKSLKPYFIKSHNYVSALKPKKTTKK